MCLTFVIETSVWPVQKNPCGWLYRCPSACIRPLAVSVEVGRPCVASAKSRVDDMASLCYSVFLFVGLF